MGIIDKISVFDCHAPFKTKTVSQKLQNPWRTDEIDVAKRKRRQLERVWRGTRLPTDRSKYSKQLHLCNRLMADERRQYIRKQIHESEKNPNKLWATVNSILHREAMPSMPDSTDLPSLCASFSTFFVDKIEKNRLKFRTDNRKPEFIPSPEIKCHLTCFEPATSEEVRKLILTSPTRTCALDPIPTSLLKSCADVLLTPITNIVNLFQKSGVFSDTLKLSHITPLLKKPSLSKDDMKNYRPVSNLNFISKLLEKIIAKRIRSHLESNDLLNRYQSAYRPMHSTETALLKVQNDLLRNLDDGKTTVLALLDLSEAFGTLDHSGVISLLENWYGIS